MYELNTDIFKRYMAGYFDGDGSITIEKQKGGYTLRVKFSQSELTVLKIIKRHYPFLKLGGGTRKEGQRPQYELRAAGKQIEPLLHDLSKYSILKANQLAEALHFIPLIGKPGCGNERVVSFNRRMF